MENRPELAIRLERITTLLVGLLFLFFPLVISTVNTDSFALPKQVLLLVVVFVGLLLLGAKSIILKNVKLRRTPFDLPLIAFIAAAALSCIFAVNHWDAWISFVPFLFTILLFFVITNSAKRAQDLVFLSASLIAGSVLVSAITILSYLKIYILPFSFAKIQTFTTFGSLFDQSIYLLLALSFALYLAWPALKKRSTDKGRLLFVGGSLLVLIGTAFTLLATFTLQKPQILPFQTGFQIGFASISQDSGRVIQGFLSGSGIGTFLTDFTRFKPASFNTNADLWNLSFLRSSSFVLELLATTGLLGILAFIYLAYRILRTKPLFPPLIFALILSLIIPFSFPTIFLLFTLLALYSVQEGLLERQKTRFFDVEARFMTLKKGVLALSETNTRSESEYQNLLPFGFLALIIIFCAVFGIYSFKFIYSDYIFQQSLVAAAQNNAQATYTLETRAINLFPQRDGYHRVFSQVNLSLANNLASSVPHGSSPSAQVQQNIYNLIQQSINSARQATTVSPQTALDWQNLSSIYRSLIGFGQNADTFSIVANQQALVLDPNNPQEYINYGGIFYQLSQWDNAINQFQSAVNLKPDFANAYYNLGHALEQKGDLQNALTQYQTAKQLIANDPQSTKQIDSEIKAIQEKIGKSAQNSSSQTNGTASNQPPLQVNEPAQQLPTTSSKVKIPAPKVTQSPTPQPSVTPSLTPTPSK